MNRVAHKNPLTHFVASLVFMCRSFLCRLIGNEKADNFVFNVFIKLLYLIFNWSQFIMCVWDVVDRVETGRRLQKQRIISLLLDIVSLELLRRGLHCLHSIIGIGKFDRTLIVHMVFLLLQIYLFRFRVSIFIPHLKSAIYIRIFY